MIHRAVAATTLIMMSFLSSYGIAGWGSLNPFSKQPTPQYATPECSQKQPAINTCQSAISDAKKECSGGGTTGMMAMASQTALAALSSTNFDAKSMCNAGDKQAYAAILGGGLVEYGCNNKVDYCSSVCKHADELVSMCSSSNGQKGTSTPGSSDSSKGGVLTSQCNDARDKGIVALTGAGINAMQVLANARVCDAYFASMQVPSAAPYASPCDVCSSAYAADYVQCPQYCPAHPGFPTCVAAGASASGCADPALAQDNPACGAIYCAYHSADTVHCQNTPTNNPSNINPSTFAAMDPGGNTVGPPPVFPGDNPVAPVYTGNPSPGNNTGFIANDSGNGGGNGVGVGGAYPGGGPSGAQQAGGQPGANFKDPGGGVSGGAAGGGFRVASVPTEGGGGANPFGRGKPGAGNGKDNQNLDLSKFLPGGELDPRRAPAGAALNQGITGANDLTNFEKVSRMMNRKRPLLKPGDGK